MFDAALSQSLDDATDLGPQGRPQLECAAELVIHCDHYHRVAFAMRLVERRFDLPRQRDILDLHEAAAADTHATAIDANGDALADLILSSVVRRQSQALVSSFLEDRERDRVMKPPLRRGSEAQDLQRIEAVGGDHPTDLRPLPGQCPGLVEEDGVDLAEKVEGPAILDEDSLLRAQRQCGQHTQRGGHPNAGAEIAVERCYGAL